jgi:outer membrane lipoprotein-sorting protein
MRKRNLLSLAAALCLAVTASAAELTLDEILAKNVAARGGLDKIKAVQTIKYSGKMNMGGMEAPFTMSKKRPESMRVDFTIQGMTGSQAYDGSSGWMLMPFMGKKDAEPLSGDMLKDAKEQADFDGPFIDSAKKGYKVELLGKTEIEGSPAYKLKVTKDGDETLVYLDADSFLEIRMEGKRKIQGQDVETETTLGNYQEVNGMLFPYSMESKAKGQPGAQVITVEKIELNPAITDDMFKMPAKKVEAPPAKPQS